MESVPRPPKNFDAICIGEALWKIVARASCSRGSFLGMSVRPGGGAVNVALALKREGMRVGLATILRDDKFGRRSREEIAAAGVDVGGVKLVPAPAEFILVDAGGGANPLPPERDDRESLDVPASWSSELLVLSGLSPVVSHAAALCKAARAARRKGTLVVIDFNASLHAWAGRDPRTIRMVLREVDVARCSISDLAVLGMDIATVRASLRADAVLIVGDGGSGSVASGAFGDVAFVPSTTSKPLEKGFGDAFTAAACKALLRQGDAGESASARWYRALKCGHAAASAS